MSRTRCVARSIYHSASGETISVCDEQMSATGVSRPIASLPLEPFRDSVRTGDPAGPLDNIKTLEDQMQRERSFLFADKPAKSSSKDR